MVDIEKIEKKMLQYIRTSETLSRNFREKYTEKVLCKNILE